MSSSEVHWLVDKSRNHPTDPRTLASLEKLKLPLSTIKNNRFSQIPEQHFTDHLFHFSLHCVTVDFTMSNSICSSMNYDFCSQNEYQKKTLLSQINWSFNDSVASDKTQANVAENRTVGVENDGFVDNSRGATLGENSTSHNQVIERNIANSIKKDVCSIVATVEIWVHDANLTVMDSVVIEELKRLWNQSLGQQDADQVVWSKSWPERFFKKLGKYSAHDGIEPQT